MRPKIIALLSSQGTACYETALYDDEDCTEIRQQVEAEFCSSSHPDAPVAGTWIDVSDNSAFWPENRDTI